MASSFWAGVFVSGFLVLLTAVIIRNWLGFQRQSCDLKGTAIPVLPTWVPWLGHSFAFSLNPLGLLTEASRTENSNHGVISVKVWSERQNIVSSQSLVQKVLASPALSRTEARLHILRTFFDEKSKLKTNSDLETDFLEHTYGLTSESGLLQSTNKFVRILEVRTFNFISFGSSWIDQSSWERAAEVSILDAPGISVEASFFSLVGTYVGEIATEALMGHNFIDDYPSFLDDITKWNSKTIPFLLGRSKWLPSMSVAAVARRRVLDAVENFRNGLLKSIDEKEVGDGESEMSDVSQIMAHRVRWGKESVVSVKQRVSADAVLLWASQKPTNPICWLLYRVYSNPKILAEIRKETEPFVKIEQNKSDLPVQEPPRVSINVDGLVTRCHLLKSAMYETLRLDTNSITYRRTTDEVLVKESQEDAIRKGRTHPRSYQIPKGELVCIPHFSQYKDPRCWEHPDVFDPSRFLVWDEKDATKISFNVGAVRALRAGFSTCPGMDCAEREIMATAAVILAMWDIVPAEARWIWPGQKMNGMSAIPLKDMRVKISRTGAGQG